MGLGGAIYPYREKHRATRDINDIYWGIDQKNRVRKRDGGGGKRVREGVFQKGERNLNSTGVLMDFVLHEA